MIDDFRSGDFKNLAGYGGDLVAANLARMNWREQFGDEKFDAIFHLASITDTTNHDQFEQTHDNVESFRRLLEFAWPTRARVIFASSASIYGATTEASAESTAAAPGEYLHLFQSDNGQHRDAAGGGKSGLDYRRVALLQCLWPARSPQGHAGEHDLPFVTADARRPASTDLQARRTDAAILFM